MRRAAFTAVLVFTCLLAAVPLGIASSGSANDPRGDTDGNPANPSSVDLIRISNGHTKDGRLWHKATVAGTMGDSVPVIYIEMRDRSSATPICDIYVGTYDGRPGVYACGTNERLGSARVARSRSSVKYVFSKAALDNPRSYDWAAGVVGPTDGTQFRFDRAPDTDDAFLTHRLR